MFDFHDEGKKQYLTKEEFNKLLERTRKRDRIGSPLDSRASDAIFFLMDPSMSQRVYWETFKERFNDVFWRVRHQLYHGGVSESSAKVRLRDTESFSLYAESFTGKRGILGTDSKATCEATIKVICVVIKNTYGC